MKMKLLNGNGQFYKVEIPTIYLQMPYLNEVWLENTEKETGLVFTPGMNGYICKPKSSHQFCKFMTRFSCNRADIHYENNSSWQNVFIIRSIKE